MKTIKNNTLINEFVPYELALAMKQLGFDESCFGATFTFNNIINDYITFCGQSNHVGYKNSEGEEVRKFLIDEFYISVPTFSQCFKWFREKCNLHPSFTRYRSSSVKRDPVLFTHLYEIGIIDESNCKIFHVGDFNGYEEAELACLNKLIEIVKTK